MKHLDVLSDNTQKEVYRKVKEQVGSAISYIFPAVIKAIERGDGKVREDILINWLNVESIRICSVCGGIMDEGWYLQDHGYACSDECAAKSEGITMEEFKKWRIYKGDIIEYLKDNGDSRNIEELSAEECDEIIDEVADECEYCYTQWY